MMGLLVYKCCAIMWKEVIVELLIVEVVYLPWRGMLRKLWRHLSHNKLSPGCDLNVALLNTKLNLYPLDHEVLLVVVMLQVVEVHDNVPW
jgi:hypothetical protein